MTIFDCLYIGEHSYSILFVCLLALAGIYVLGFCFFFGFHLLFLPMVTPGLAFLRALVWPIFWATGWPHGVPLPMD